jgi:hypothetical protein
LLSSLVVEPRADAAFTSPTICTHGAKITHEKSIVNIEKMNICEHHPQCVYGLTPSSLSPDPSKTVDDPLRIGSYRVEAPLVCLRYWCWRFLRVFWSSEGACGISRSPSHTVKGACVPCPMISGVVVYQGGQYSNDNPASRLLEQHQFPYLHKIFSSLKCSRTRFHAPTASPGCSRLLWKTESCW